MDPSMAPAGKTNLMVTVAMGYDCFEHWGKDKGFETYKQIRDQVAEHFLGKLETFFPGTRKNIEVKDISTPITMQNYTHATKGAFNGWAFTMDQSMDKRLSQTTPISNLYLAGAFTSPGGGQSAVLMSGYLAAKSILKAEGRRP
jgi:phytoene dehydrogenase-like protein